jgi:hypothetical protein
MKPAAVHVERTCGTGAISGLQIAIPHRTPELTRAAFRRAAELAKDLDARVRLIDIQVVPSGLPLHRPQVHPGHSIRKMRSLAEESDVPIAAEIVYARDWEQGLRRSLVPGSIVLLTIKRRWWRFGFTEKRMAARLRKAGHQVVWIEL